MTPERARQICRELRVYAEYHRRHSVVYNTTTADAIELIDFLADLAYNPSTYRRWYPMQHAVLVAIRDTRPKEDLS